MKIHRKIINTVFSKKFILTYLFCSSCVTTTLHFTGNAPWSEIADEKYAYLDSYEAIDGPGKGLYEQSLEDGQVSNVEYLMITSFHEKYNQMVEEGKKSAS
tara:strand:+ start:72 stop:374 length:303 start_codon:yes stop_codon:yes gene_type:complete